RNRWKMAGERTRLLAWQGRAPRVDPGSQPIRAHVRGGVAELPDESRPGFAIETIVILVSVIGKPAASASIGYEHDLEPGMRLNTIFKGMVCGVGDELRIIG